MGKASANKLVYSEDDVKFPPLPAFIKVQFSRPLWSSPSILALYFSSKLKERLLTNLNLFQIENPELVDSGYTAIVLALRGIDSDKNKKRSLGKGDEIIIPSFVCKAVIQAVIAVGATPVFADVNEKFGLDVQSVKKLISKKTKAVIAVHQYGIQSDIKELEKLCKSKGIFLLDDSAVPFGIKSSEKVMGNYGNVGVFSFNMGKTIVATGGGVLIQKNKTNNTNNTQIERPSGDLRRLLFFITNIHAKRIFAPLFSLARKLGIASREENIKELYKVSANQPRNTTPRLMSRLQMAGAVYQIERIESILAKQKKMSALYYELLKEVKQIKLPEIKNNTFTYFVIRIPDRYALSKHLSEAGIETQWTFFPLHLQKAYADYNKPNSPLKFTEKVWKETLSLPMSPNLTEKQVKFVCAKIKEYYGNKIAGASA